MKLGSRIGIAALLVLGMAVGGVDGSQDNAKKLVQFGWDVRPPSVIAEKIEEYQAAPFDGIVTQNQVSYTFYTRDATEEFVAAEIETLKGIEWGKFTDNFFKMYAGDNVDWYDDAMFADDSHIMRNVGWCARMAKAGGCKGLMFDPEFVYWGQPHCPWKYEWQKRKDEKTFEQFEQIVRKRGAQIMNRIEAEFPDPVIFNLFWGSYSEFLRAGLEFDPINRENILKKQYYGLLNAFMVGMLEGADPGTVIIDGNEGSYYYATALNFYQGYHNIHQNALQLIPPELQAKYRAQVRCGHAIYADVLCNTRGAHSMSTYLTPAERAQHVESNVYWALKTSDRYVWWYNEKLSLLRNWNVDPEIAPAIEAAKQKVAQNEPMKIDVMPLREKAVAEYRKAEYRVITPKTASIGRLEGAAPVIDGGLDDAAWERAALLGPFVNFGTARVKELETTTTARMTYDDERLYLAFWCVEPVMKNLHAGKFNDEQTTWLGDVVEVALAAGEPAGKYYHIRVNIRNERWDSLTTAGKEVYGLDSSWQGDYATAMRQGEDQWAVEFGVPWTSLGRKAPAAGETIKGNLMRRTNRREGPWESEYVLWTESRRARYVEAEHFGTWVFE